MRNSPQDIPLENKASRQISLGPNPKTFGEPSDFTKGDHSSEHDQPHQGRLRGAWQPGMESIKNPLIWMRSIKEESCTQISSQLKSPAIGNSAGRRLQRGRVLAAVDDQDDLQRHWDEMMIETLQFQHLLY